MLTFRNLRPAEPFDCQPEYDLRAAGQSLIAEHKKQLSRTFLHRMKSHALFVCARQQTPCPRLCRPAGSNSIYSHKRTAIV